MPDSSISRERRERVRRVLARRLASVVVIIESVRRRHNTSAILRTAEAFGLSRVTNPEGAALVGRTDASDYSGIVFPIYWPGDVTPKEYFLRRDHPDLELLVERGAIRAGELDLQRGDAAQ